MVQTKVEINNYLLKGNLKNEAWIIRNNKTLFKTIDGKRRRLRYCEGETSIFFDEQNPESEPTFLVFEHGSLRVHVNDETRNKFIQIHPDFNRKFFLHDEHKEAKEQLVKLQQEDEVRLMLAELDDEQKEATAIVMFGMNVVQRWSLEKIAVECYNMLKNNPKRLKEVINDPATELIYLVSAAISLGVVEIAADKTAIKWSDSKEEIIPIPRGVNPLTEMAHFLRTNEALVTLQEIGDRVKVKKGIKVVKKSTKPIPRATKK